MIEHDELTPEEEEAIQKVILSGVAGDFQDVVNAVNDRFQLKVGAAQVEAVYKAMRDEQKEQAEATARATHRPHPPTTADPGEEVLRKVLRFAEEMGGFEQARQALTAVEDKLRKMI